MSSRTEYVLCLEQLGREISYIELLKELEESVFRSTAGGRFKVTTFEMMTF